MGAAQVEAMQQSEHLYDDLARSLAPGVFGHVDIKKAILLMLLGGVHKQTSEVRGITQRLPNATSARGRRWRASTTLRRTAGLSSP